MDSDEENEMVKRFDGSGLGLKGDKGPQWDGQQTTWTAFWYNMCPYLKLCKLGATISGNDRDEKEHADAGTRAGYERRKHATFSCGATCTGPYLKGRQRARH